jgi:hypothetical protein
MRPTERLAFVKMGLIFVLVTSVVAITAYIVLQLIKFPNLAGVPTQIASLSATNQSAVGLTNDPPSNSEVELKFGDNKIKGSGPIVLGLVVLLALVVILMTAFCKVKP